MGRRREDIDWEEGWPGRLDDLQKGDYWKYKNKVSTHPENLTKTVWGFVSPIGGKGYLENHTVREHEDGTISVIPGDGSSNSILFHTSKDRSWHGFIDHGRWYE